MWLGKASSQGTGNQCYPTYFLTCSLAFCAWVWSPSSAEGCLGLALTLLDHGAGSHTPCPVRQRVPALWVSTQGKTVLLESAGNARYNQGLVLWQNSGYFRGNGKNQQLFICRSTETSEITSVQKHRCLQHLCSFPYWVCKFRAYTWNQCLSLRSEGFHVQHTLGHNRELPGSPGVSLVSHSSHHIQHLPRSIAEGQWEDTAKSRSRFNGETLGTNKFCLHF